MAYIVAEQHIHRALRTKFVASSAFMRSFCCGDEYLVVEREDILPKTSSVGTKPSGPRVS